MNICVYGSPDNISEKCIDVARRLGEYIGKNNHNLVYGGFKDGLLGEVALSAHRNGARIISILPITPRKGYQEFKHSTIVYHESNKRLRKKLQEDNADVFVVLPEGLGVLDELFETLLLKQYSQHNKPIYILNIDHKYDLLIELLNQQGCKDLYQEISEKELYKIGEE